MVASEFKMEFNTPVLQEHFKGLRGAFHRGIEICASSNVNPFTGEPEFIRDVLADHEGPAMWEYKVHFFVTTPTIGMPDEIEIYLQRFQ